MAPSPALAQPPSAAAQTTPARFGVAAASAPTPQTKAAAASQNFEAVFLNSMFQAMFTGIDGDGPFGGGGTGGGLWRSFLSDEYAKSMAKAGGIGIAADVYRTLLGAQEAAAK